MKRRINDAGKVNSPLLMKLSTLLFTTLLLVLGVSSHPVQIRDNARPTPPTEDPFYSPPEGFEDQPLGAILRHRTVPGPGFLFSKSNVKETIQILYRSSNSSGSPMATVTTVFIPTNADTSKLLSYQIYEDSAYLNCAPSYGVQYKSDPEAIISQAEFLFIQAALNQGWVVNSPDYEGPNSAFTAGILSGKAVLDSIRAVLNSGNITGVSKTAGVAMWGYSGGSLASGWAGELQPSYAPELKFVGAALGGFVTNITDVSLRVNNGQFSGLVPAAMYGLSQEYPELKEYLDTQLVKAKEDDYNKVSQQCLIQDSVQFANQDWGEYFKDGVDILSSPVGKKVTSANNMGKTTPKIPYLVYHAKNDEVSRISNVEKIYDFYCSNGADIEFIKDQAHEHILESVAGSADAFNWLRDRLNGKPVEKGCRTRTTFSTTFDKGAVGAFGDEIASSLKGLFGIPIGPKAIA